MQRRFTASEPDRRRVADITDLPTLKGFVYLATVLDVFRRKVEGCAISACQTAELVEAARGMAAPTRAPRGPAA